MTLQANGHVSLPAWLQGLPSGSWTRNGVPFDAAPYSASLQLTATICVLTQRPHLLAKIEKATVIIAKLGFLFLFRSYF